QRAVLGSRAALLPARESLQRIVRARCGRGDVDARGRAEAPGDALRAPRRHPELPLPDLYGAEALSRPGRAAGGPAARRVVLPHAAVPDAGPASRVAPQLPEPRGRGAAAA